MANSFMKKCSVCDKLGAAYQTTDKDGNPVQLCHECRMKQVAADKNSDAEDSPAD